MANLAHQNGAEGGKVDKEDEDDEEAIDDQENVDDDFDSNCSISFDDADR